jgi:beta-xylosidase
MADDVGGKYDMKDYWVLSHTDPESPAEVILKLLDLEDIKWSSKQLWAPDPTEKDGMYYLYFPAKDKSEDQLFRIGVAISDTPDGHFTPEPDYIPGSYSIDPAVLHDDDESYHLYWGG